MPKYLTTYGRDGSRVCTIDGRVVTQAEFDAAVPAKPLQVGCAFHTPGAWPLVSNALGVHRSQVGEAFEHARKNGVPTEFTADGKVILRDRNHRKAYMRMQGYFDRDGTYGDN